MEPYTNEGIFRVEEGVEGEVAKPRLYDLVGIVVHSGQASAGHYYSFIKNKRFVLKHFPAPLSGLFLHLTKFLFLQSHI